MTNTDERRRNTSCHGTSLFDWHLLTIGDDASSDSILITCDSHETHFTHETKSSNGRQVAAKL